MRGIVAELPANFPFQITDASGRAHDGVYALNVLIWNRGGQEISPSDFLDNAPLRLAVGKNAYIMMADAISNDDQLTCSTSQVDEQNVDIYFDCINPGDHINVILFYGGEPMADVEILGRIRGQTTSLDHQAEEVKAGVGPHRYVVGASQVPARLPLHADFEPPLLENIKGMILTVFTAKKQRLSTSMFDWAKPVIVTRKKNKRLRVDDWMV
ncbi:hypothetical protein Jab_1c22390 [Janthinobacterium sp. HH01]|nr:hypothetical protein Jab_1c22390 [Janthinobacterium sp. HH01]